MKNEVKVLEGLFDTLTTETEFKLRDGRRIVFEEYSDGMVRISEEEIIGEKATLIKDVRMLDTGNKIRYTLNKMGITLTDGKKMAIQKKDGEWCISEFPIVKS